MDFNKATLVSFTQNKENLSLLEQVAYFARVSNPENQNNHQTSEKLCKYLMKHHHWSPFEMVNIVIEIETTRDIARQLLRHRSFSFQEFSQRYAVVDTNMFVNRECRLQDSHNRQMSVDLSEKDNTLHTEFENFQNELIELEKKYYKLCIDKGVAKEQARSLLSEGLTRTRLYMNGTLRSWIHYLQIRCDRNTTQKEHADVAMKIKKEISTIFPLIQDL
jgi:thymidylate synthase (FAD)